MMLSQREVGKIYYIWPCWQIIANENEKIVDSGMRCSFERMQPLAAEVNTRKPWVWETGKRIKLKAFLVRIQRMGVNKISKIAPFLLFTVCLSSAEWIHFNRGNTPILSLSIDSRNISVQIHFHPHDVQEAIRNLAILPGSWVSALPSQLDRKHN